MSTAASVYGAAVLAFNAGRLPVARLAAETFLTLVRIHGPEALARTADCPRWWVVKAAAKAEAIRTECDRHLAATDGRPDDPTH